LCESLNFPFRTYEDACNHFATWSGRVAFDKSCEELLSTNAVPELFDAILIDEAQDFAENYFRLCYQALRQPKRIIWGYDEVQSLEELAIPTAQTLFGLDVDGKPLVDLDGYYPGEIEKDMILYQCYRNPRPALIAAHSFGLGLRRKCGALQFIDTVSGWQDIGYEVRGAKDNKLKTGEEITLYRPESNSPHLLEKLAGYHNLVSWNLFDDRKDEIEWIVQDIERHIQEEELRPDEIVVIALDSRKKIADKEYELLYKSLAQKGITSVRLGTDVPIDVFRVPGAVTITSVFRAKGNEASLIYVYGFEVAGSGKEGYDTIRNRNLAFTAMTRTKGWLVLSGVGNVAKTLFEEIAAILEKIGEVSFVVPDINKITRNLETYENQRRRKRILDAEKSIQKTIKNLADVNPEELSPELKKQLYRLLFGDTPE
jgi:superfamily I DNA and RNA helicase